MMSTIFTILFYVYISVLVIIFTTVATILLVDYSSKIVKSLKHKIRLSFIKMKHQKIVYDNLVFHPCFVAWAGDKFDDYASVIKECVDDLSLNDQKINFYARMDAVNAMYTTIKNDVERSHFQKTALQDGHGNLSVDEDYVSFSWNVKAPNLKSFSFIMSHELRHGYQFKNNILSRNRFQSPLKSGSNVSFRVWDSEIYSTIVTQFSESYHLAPWEYDANSYALSFSNYYGGEYDDTEYGEIAKRNSETIKEENEKKIEGYKIEAYKFMDYDWVRRIVGQYGIELI